MPNSSVFGQFYPHRSEETEPRLRHIEDAITELFGKLAQPFASTQVTTPTGVVDTGVNGSGGGGGGGSSGGPIPESNIAYDRYGGHDHDAVVSRPIIIAGDVTGFNQAATVVKIENKPIPVPGVGDDQRFIRYNNGTGAFEYAAATSGAPLIIPQVTKTSNYTATVADTGIWVDATAGAVTITLYTAVGNGGHVVVVKKVDGSANNVTVDAAGTETIDGALTQLLAAQYSSYTLVSDGTAWWVI